MATPPPRRPPPSDPTAPPTPQDGSPPPAAPVEAQPLPEAPAPVRARVIERGPPAPPAAQPAAPPLPPAGTRYTPPPAKGPQPPGPRIPLPPGFTKPPPPSVQTAQAPPPRPPLAPVPPSPATGYQPPAPPAYYAQPPAYATPYGQPAYAYPYGTPPAYGYNNPMYQPAYGTPYGYGANPYGYYMPAYTPIPPGYNTGEGLRSLRNATYAVIVYNLMAIVSNMVVLVAIGQMNQAITTSNLNLLDRAESTLNGATVLFLIGGLVGLAGVCMGFSGMGKMNKENSAFGAEHQKALGRGMGLLALSIVLYIVVAVVNFMTSSSLDAFANTPTPAALAAAMDQFYGMLLLVTLLEVLAALVAGFAMKSFVERLMTQRGRSAVNMFWALSMLGPVMIFFMAVAMPMVVGPIPTSASPQQLMAALQGILNGLVWMAVVPSVANFVTVLALGLYVRMVRAAEDGTKNMVRTGSHDPDAQWGAAYGGYAPQAAPAAATYGGYPPP